MASSPKSQPYYPTVTELALNYALYGADHGREPDQLARIKLRARVRVRGELGTEYHAGGTNANLSPFSATWTP